MIVDAQALRNLADDPEALLLYLKSLSNSQFRRASAELGEHVLVEVGTDCFWSVFQTLFRDNRKAYLGTLLKALATRIANENTSSNTITAETDAFDNEDFAALCNEMNETDRKKLLLSILPHLHSPALAERFFRQCGLMESSTWIPFLLQVRTAPCAFLLLKSLRYVEHDRALLIRTCHFLIKNGDCISFNLASLMRASFGLEEVKGTFSLNLKPYQLNRIEQNYDAFLSVIRF